MEMPRHVNQQDDLPSGLPGPARRALVSAGLIGLEQLTHVSEAEILALHGVGPKALDLLRRALCANGQAFAVRERGRSSS
jgi:hypothetical protein